MYSSVSPKDEIWFLRVCHHVSNAVYWLPTPFSSFPFTSPPVLHRVPSHFKRSLLATHTILQFPLHFPSRASPCAITFQTQSTGYPLHSPVSPSLPLPCVTECHHISNAVYWLPTPFYSFPFTSPPVGHRVPSHFKRSLRHTCVGQTLLFDWQLAFSFSCLLILCCC